MKKFLVVLAILVAKESFGQENSTVVNANSAPSGVVVHKDPRVDLLVRKQADINTKVKKSTARTGRGYRLMVLNTNSREEAIAAKAKIYTYFPDLNAYLSYQSPYFKLKAGNFQTRSEAERYRKNMNTMFPKGVFIINDVIEIKPEKEEGAD